MVTRAATIVHWDHVHGLRRYTIALQLGVEGR